MSQGQQEKTELPTHKRLRDLRKKGDIAISRDLTATASVVAFAVGCLFLCMPLLQAFMGMLNHILTLQPADIDNTQAVNRIHQEVLINGMLSSLPFVGLLTGSALITAVLQARGLVALEKVKPNLQHINPLQGIKKIFSLNTVMELIKLLIKAALLVGIVYALLLQMLPVLFHARHLPSQGILLLGGKVLATLTWLTLIGFAFTTAFDVWFQHWNFIRRNKMSVDEVRREHKETEGDPHLQGMRRQLRQELSMQAMLDNVRKASVIVVNPTHIAVALYYQQGSTDLPVVLGKGEGHIAEEIRAIAAQEKIPVLRDVQLARRLHANAPIDQYIPDEFIEPVAVIMKWLKKNKTASRL